MPTEQCRDTLSGKQPLLLGGDFQFPDRSGCAAHLVQLYNREQGQAGSLRIQGRITHLVGGALSDTYSLLLKLSYNLCVLGELTTSRMGI